MNYDPKIEVVGSGKNFYKGGYVLLSQITRLELPKWIGPIKNGLQQKLVQMDKDYYWRIEIRTPPLPPKYSYDFDPNYRAIILTPTEAREWLSREGYDIPDDLAKLNPAETEQNAVPVKGSKVGNFFWKLYEKTLKVIVDAVLEKWWPKQ